MTHMSDRYRAALAALENRGQAHALQFWNELDEDRRRRLLDELESIPWDELAPLIQTHVLNEPAPPSLDGLDPAPVHPHQPTPELAEVYTRAQATGERLLRAGAVAAFTVAGGQGTRLGIDGPKGAVAVTPVKKKTLFQLFAETILAVRQRYGSTIRWYVMTSPANHEQTRRFFTQHDYFGLPADDVMMFNQAMLPAFDRHGKLLLADKHRLALSPDGHGGSLKALVSSGALRDMQARGVEVISYFQVDNPLVRLLDPLFIGLHVERGAEMSSKVTPKVDDLEKVGNVCVQNGHTVVIEYSDLPDELAHAKNADGSRKFDVGSLAIHLLSTAFVDRIVGKRFGLPYHRAEKKAPCVDAGGVVQTPEAPNAVKLETFVFDALPLAQRTLQFEILRSEEFSPVKNATGVDSLETAIRDQIRRAARWLEAAGVRVPRKPDGAPDAALEIAPSAGLTSAQLAECLHTPESIERAASVYID